MRKLQNIKIIKNSRKFQNIFLMQKQIRLTEIVMPDFSEMIKKAKEMQEKMKEAQENIKNIQVEGSSGGNLVKIIMSGDYEIKSIIVSEEAKKEKTDILLDLIIAAYNNAKENLKRKSNEELSKITGGISFPGDLNFPLK